MNSLSLFLLKQTAEKGDEGRTDHDDTTAGHELLNALGLCAGVIITVTFHEVDYTPYAETCADCDNESLENANCRCEKCHIVCTFHYIS